MSFVDKTIVCADCGQEFVHSADDQARYAERGFTNDPKRCRQCREKRKAQSGRGGGPRRGPGGGGGGGGRRPMGGGGDRSRRPSFEVVCSSCGAVTTVPFEPKGDRPVYCRDCYRSQQR